jgi:two-component system chemotaxis response regulator CheB
MRTTLQFMSARRPSAQPPRFELVVLLASVGGLSPISVLLAGLPASFPTPLLVMQLRYPTDRPDGLAWLLASRTALPVRSASDGALARTRGVTVIPPGQDATLDHNGCLCLKPQAERTGTKRTDGDALLASAAAASPNGTVIGVILSGTMHDGTDGVRAVKRHGGRVLVQDPATATAHNMPASAIATGCADFILPPEGMSSALICMAMAPGGAQLLTVPLPHWAALGA